MPIAVSVWRIDGAKAVSVSPSTIADESLLEDILEDDIGLLGLPDQVLVIGRQVVTDYSGRIDLLCVDQEGDLVVVEIKRDKTPREVVAQAMDYGYWVRDLGYDDVRDIYARYRPGGDFDDAFRGAFDIEPPEEVNGAHQLVIVASALDAASERIVTYVQSFGAPVNVVFFQTFQENGVQYLTRTWLVDPVEEAPTRKTGAKKQKVPWNGRDWYVSFGEDGGWRDWDDAQLYGFVSAGGGPWYIGTIKKLPVGGCVFVNLPGKGYVGVGVVTREAVPARDFTVSVNGHHVPFTEAPHSAPELTTRAALLDDDETEWIVSVRWLATVPRDQAISFKGRYGNQNSATRLTHVLTRETVLERLGLTEADLDAATASSTDTL
jgi:hypothetical protein